MIDLSDNEDKGIQYVGSSDDESQRGATIKPGFIGFVCLAMPWAFSSSILAPPSYPVGPSMRQVSFPALVGWLKWSSRSPILPIASQRLWAQLG